MKRDGQGTQVALLRELLHRLAFRAPLAALTAPPDVLPRTLEVSPPPAYLLYECIDKSYGCIRMNATYLVNPM
jgi:hypothetical protein